MFAATRLANEITRRLLPRKTNLLIALAFSLSLGSPFLGSSSGITRFGGGSFILYEKRRLQNWRGKKRMILSRCARPGL